MTVGPASSLFSVHVSKQGALEHVQKLPQCFVRELPYQAVYLWCSPSLSLSLSPSHPFPVFNISYSHLYFFLKSPDLSNCSSYRNPSMTLLTLLCFSLPFSALLYLLFQMGGTRTAHSIGVDVYHGFTGITYIFL